MIDSIIRQLQTYLVSLGIVTTTVFPSPTPTISPTISVAPATQAHQGFQNLLIQPTQPVQRIAPQSVNVPVQSGTSRNWAGYASTQGVFTFVSGTWTIPSVTPTGHAGADVAWVGIGGITKSDLIQSGTQNLISSSGQVTTSAFYEVLPDVSQVIPISINIGDSISVTITEVSLNQWKISFIDNTNGKAFNTIIPYVSTHSSAEWIEEAPSDGNLELPLDNFSSIQFLDTTAAQNGNSVNIVQSNAQPITMINTSNQVIAAPSSVGGDSRSFLVNRTNAQTIIPVPIFDRNVRSFRRRGFGIGHYNPLTQQQRSQRFWIRQSTVPTVTQTPTDTPAITPEPEQIQISSPSGNFWSRWLPFFNRRGNRTRRITQ